MPGSACFRTVPRGNLADADPRSKPPDTPKPGYYEKVTRLCHLLICTSEYVKPHISPLTPKLKATVAWSPHTAISQKREKIDNQKLKIDTSCGRDALDPTGHLELLTVTSLPSLTYLHTRTLP